MLNKKMSLLYTFARFVCGGAAYNVLELLWRGFTHISMFFLGGLCFCIMIRISGSRGSLIVKSFVSAGMITLSECLAGCVLNLWLKLNVWDYSGEACQFMGQVCLRFFCLWWILSAAVLQLCKVAGRGRHSLTERMAPVLVGRDWPQDTGAVNNLYE